MLNCVDSNSSTKPIRNMVCPSSDENLRNSEGDIIELKDGRLLLAWSKFIGNTDHATADIAAKFSNDKGRTWGKEFIIQKNTGKQNVMSISFLRLQSGKILFFFLQKNSLSDLQLFVRESTDEAKNWSTPLRITQGMGYFIMNNARVIQLKSGRILAPIAYSPDIVIKRKEQVCFCHYSDDDGKTWFKGKGHVGLKDSGAMEPGLVQRSDGSVMMIIRTSLDRIYKSFSYDRGDNWTQGVRSDLCSPSAPATITRIPDSSDLLLIWNNNPLGNQPAGKKRTPLTSAISSDGGKTWQNFKNLENDPDSGYAYTSITFSGDNVLLSYYLWKKRNPNTSKIDLIFHSIPLQWFYEK